MESTDTTAANAHKETKICPGYEPIVGYKLEKLIGRGGFGEVWQSEAPGGLRKAVKFVYGATDQQRAVRELRSLERIKGVHHPFLLTLERFGVIDDRLVIVTELADGSLEDVYNRHLQRGSCGIPRVSLLSYMHDAADALDYLHSKYQLQHLDIKPGNLLLVGGHAKVGDFGLLKDLRDADCSMVGGLTPVYAPPELFDGRPSLHSDQYSLAVMYQELLTGSRPFTGRTIAQLATQHVHSAPNLNPLPASDRPILARALEKDPQRRYGSCCEFIDALKATGNRATRSFVGKPNYEPTDVSTGVLKAVIGGGIAAVKDLPQLKFSAPRVGVRITSHALVIAVGGAGAEVIHHLRDRVASHRAACPLDLHSILIDTDATTVHAARLAEVSDRVPVCQSIHAPLKNPQEYRTYKGLKYKSISRRWLYNVPRSCMTEGMRPLGRLALVDHGDEILRQLKDSVCHLSAVSGTSLPSIYVVGSMDGGTGSGMLLDLIHLVRHVLDDHEMAGVQVMPILLTGPIVRDNRRALAGADAAALITEMLYYLNPGNGYPGDDAADWPSVPSARTPLTDAYIISAGLTSQSIASPAITASEYIWVNSSSANEFLAAARKDDDKEGNGHRTDSVKVRSVGIVRLRTPKLLEENLLAPSIVRQLLFKWLGDPVEARELSSELRAKLVRKCEISEELVFKKCCGRWPVDPQIRANKLNRLLGDLPSNVCADGDLFQAALQSIVSDMFGDSSESLVSSFGLMLSRELTVRLSDTRCDLAMAVETLKRMMETTSELARVSRNNPLTDTVENPSNKSSISAGDWLTRLIQTRVADCYDKVTEMMSKLLDDIEDRAAVLAQCVQLVSVRLSGNDEEVWQFVDENIRNQVGPALVALRAQASPSVVGLQSIVNVNNQVKCEGLLQSLLDLALPLISKAMTWGAEATERQSPISQAMAMDASQAISEVALNDQAREMRWDDPAVIAEALRSVKPSLLNFGGCQRMLLVVGSEAERIGLEPKIREIHNGPLTTNVVPGSAAMLICEAQQINLKDIQSRMIGIVGDSLDVMGRLAARNDIDWQSSSLAALNTKPL